jgi:hypothetical protein
MRRGASWLTALVLLGAGVGATAASLAPAVVPAKPGTHCVAPPETMRRDHMRFLLHQREVTVHEGGSGARFSLEGCIGCHASAKTGSVAQADTDFCVACHRYAAVRIDCFECHSSRPEPGAKVAAGDTR